MTNPLPEGFEDALHFPLIEALFGRRSRRFSMGASIPDGCLAFDSKKEPLPLSETERMMVLSAAAGNTAWHYMITRHAAYAPHLSNYAGAAGGRVFASAAGFHTSEIFFTDDTGVYFFATRDTPALAAKTDEGTINLEELLEAHKSRIRKLACERMNLPRRDPFVEGHNTWSANLPGSLLVIPVADLAQHMLLNLCYLAQNRFCIYDDANNEHVPGLDRFSELVDITDPLPLSFIEQQSLAECAAEVSMACFAGMLMLQAMGLGGWMYDGLNPLAVIGASGDPEVPGLGFRYDTSDKWAVPNPTGLPGIFEGFCPPHYPDMTAAVEAVAQRKFGPGGPFHPDTPGPWRDSARVRGCAHIHSEQFKQCVALQAQYIYDRFGKFPGTVPSIFVLPYLQAHHLDLEFYDHYFKPGAYLRTHAEHLAQWHGDERSL